MVTDLATLGIKVDSSEALSAAGNLDRLSAAGARAEGGVGRVTSASRLLGSTLRLLGIASVGAALGDATRRAMDFADAMAEVSTLVDTTTVSMAELTAVAREQAVVFGSAPTEQASALYQIISAGASDAAIATELLTAANRLAVGGVTDVETAADGLTSILNAYGLEVENATAVSDAMFVSMRAGKTTIAELSHAVGRVAPLAAQAGISFQELLGATAALTKGGISTNESMTGLRAIMAAVVRPTQEATELAEALGLEFNATALASQGLAGFMEEVVEATGGSQEAMARLFGGVEALVPALALAGQAGQDLSVIMGDMANSAGATEQAFNRIAESPGFRFDQSLARLQVVAIDVGNVLLDIVVPGLELVVDNLDIVVTVLAAAATGLVAYRAALLLTAAAQTTFGALILTSARQLGVLGAAQVAAAGATAGLRVAVTALATSFTGMLTVALGAAAAAYIYLSRQTAEARQIHEQLVPTLERVNALLRESRVLAGLAAEGMDMTGAAAATASPRLNLLGQMYAFASEQALSLANNARLAAVAVAQQELSQLTSQRNSLLRTSLFRGSMPGAGLFDALMGDDPVERARDIQQLERGMRQLEETIDNLQDAPDIAFDPMVSSLRSVAGAAGGASTALQGATTALTEADDAADGAASSTSRAAEEAEKLADKMDEDVEVIRDFIASLEDERRNLGLTADETLLLRAHEMLLIAATEEARKAILARTQALIDARAAQRASDFIRDVVEPLELEVEMLGMTIEQRQIATAVRQAETAGILEGTEAWTLYWAAVDNRDAALNAETAARNLLDYLQDMADETDRAARSMQEAFGDIGGAIGDVASIFASFAAEQERSTQRLARIQRDYGEDSVEYARELTLQTAMQLDHYRGLASAAKGFFEEGSAGYRVMAAAEKAFALVQLANTAINVAAGASKMFAMLGPFAFPAVAAMIAVMAGLGFSGGGSAVASLPSAADIQAGQNTGTVLGDSTAKSNSIANSLEIMSKNSNRELEYSNTMVRHLRGIENNIGALAALVSKQLGLSNGTFGDVGAGTFEGGLGGVFAGIAGNIPVVGSILQGIGNFIFGSKKTVTLLDEGIRFMGTMNGVAGEIYQTVQTTKKKSFLGISIGGSTNTSTTSSPVDAAMTQQVSLLINSLRGTITEAASILGIAGAEAALSAFRFSLNISLKDLSGTEIQAELEAAFSKLGDDMVRAAIPGIEKFQKVGEGMLETLARLTRNYISLDTALMSIGRSFGAVGASSLEARESLIALFGTIDELIDQTNFYRENFLTEAEQIAPVMVAVEKEMKRLGLSSVDTIDEFKAVVNGLDLTTQAGQETFAALMAVAQGFYAVEEYERQQAEAQQRTAEAAAAEAASLAKKRAAMEIELLRLNGNAVEALARQRAMELAELDASLRPLQRQLYLAQDIAAARDQLSAAYQRESTALEGTIKKFTDFSDTLREFRDSLTTVGGQGSSYRTAQVNFLTTSALAAAGDEAALGNLAGVSSAFLAASRANASSLVEYNRDVSAVARAVDQAIGAADEAVDYAQLQLEALEQSVTGLIDINESVLSVEEAIDKLTGLLAQQAPQPAQARLREPANETQERIAETQERVREEVKKFREEMQPVVETMTKNLADMTRLFKRWDRGDAIAFTVDPDSPVPVNIP